MSPRNFDLKTFVVCDDVRQEVNGKHILIGVYADALILPKFPAVLQKLVFFVAFKLKTTERHEASFYVAKEDDKKIVDVSQTIEGHDPSDPVLFQIQLPNLTFNSPNKFFAHLVVDGEDVVIGEFTARGPKTSEETRQLGIAPNS